ncbi:MAG: MerR family transcriptional regulator [Actinobacteria bacterium]|nr:MerR family transcriptional regulator [Actinomycetota bacterium]
MADTPPAGRLTIGGVLVRLKPEFPDISISKIRFLEAEGLLAPGRTASGYRVYTDKDVDRLRYVLTAQRERFWPLKVIREALDAMDRGLEAPPPQQSRAHVPAVPADSDVPSSDYFSADLSTLRLTAEEVSRSSGLDSSTLAALVTYGLLRPDAEGLFDAAALPIAASAAALASYGIEARHLRPFRTAADREIGLADQALAPLRGRRDERADQLRADLLHHCLGLHAALVKAGLSQR